MNFSRVAFNLYLLLVLLAVGSCATTPAKQEARKHRKEASTLLLHVEVNADQTGQNWSVPILRDNPIMVTVTRNPFVDVASVEHASVIDQPGGGFAIKIQFDRHGTLLLENITGSYPNHRIAVFSQFSDARWLAAPLITHRITDGVFVFTPDATREEAERIVRGLNNVAAKLKK
jgi:preprotein translocase subunit SecD